MTPRRSHAADESLYAVLGVAPRASPAEIRAAYLSAARRVRVPLASCDSLCIRIC